MRSHRPRFTVLALLVSVGVASGGLAAMRDASDVADETVFMLTLAVLATALLGALVRRGEGTWTGFALFGCGYFLLAFIPSFWTEGDDQPRLLTTRLIDYTIDRLHQLPTWPANLPFETTSSNNRFWKRSDGQNVPMTAQEESLHADHLNQTNAYWAARNRLLDSGSLNHARNIGHCLFSLMWGLVGCVLGRGLAVQRCSAHE